MLIAFLVSTYLASFKEGLCVLTAMYSIIRSVLELSVLQNALNNHVGFCMMGVLKFLLYLVCLLGEKKGDFKLPYKRAKLFLFTINLSFPTVMFFL